MAREARQARPEGRHRTNYRSFFHKIYERFLKIRGQPRQIARGFALGLFVGMTPTLGFQMVLSVSVAALLKWNKISAAVGVWITNPITAPLIYTMTYVSGARLLGYSSGFKVPKEFSLEVVFKMVQKAPEVILALFVGGVIVGLPIAIAGYYLSYSAISTYRKRSRRRRRTSRESADAGR